MIIEDNRTAETLVLLMWREAGNYEDGHDVGCLCAHLAKQGGPSASDMQQATVDALVAISDWHADNTGTEQAVDYVQQGQIDDLAGDTIYWWADGAETAWSTDVPDGWPDEAREGGVA